MAPSRPRPADARNPWPCVRCGAPVRLSAKAGRVPWGAWFWIGALVALTALGLWRQPVVSGAIWVGLLTAMVLMILWSLYRARRRQWVCDRCGARGVPRARPAGEPGFMVAIPTYNNAGSIAQVVAGVLEAAPRLPLVVVDDGSTDGTGDAARAAMGLAGPSPGEGPAETEPGAPPGSHKAPNRAPDAPAREVLRHPVNRGKGATLLTALQHAFAHGYSHLVTLDGDGQHLPQDIPKLVDEARKHPQALLVGARDLGGENVQGISRFGRRFSNFWLWVQTGVRLADSQSGFRVYPTAPVLSLGLRGRRFDFEVEVLTLGARARLPLGAVPVGVHYPPPSERVSHFNKAWDNVRISLFNVRALGLAPLWPLGWPYRLDAREPPSAIVRNWTGRSLGGRLGHRFFAGLLRLLGPWPAYAMLRPVCLYYTLAQRSRTEMAAPVVDAVLGPVRGLARWRRRYRHVLTFAACILERAMVQVLGPQSFELTSEGREHITAPLKKGRGVILLNAHVGNNAVAGAILASARAQHVPVNLVMLDNEAEYIKRAYERMGALDRMPKVIAINRGQMPVLRILKALRAGEAVAVQADRVVDKNWTEVEFLGRKAPFPTGVFTMAAAAKVPVVATFAMREGARRYRFVALPPREVVLPREGRAEALASHAQWFAQRLEDQVRRYPLQWFNFFDFYATPAPPPEGTAEPPPTEREAPGEDA